MSESIRRWSIRRVWWWWQRRYDLRVLWPMCKYLAMGLDEARASFMAHAMHDACWIDYYGERRLIEIVGALK